MKTHSTYHELEKEDHVRYYINNEDYIEIFPSKSEPGMLTIRVYDGEMTIKPSVANQIHIGLDPYIAAYKNQLR